MEQQNQSEVVEEKFSEATEEQATPTPYQNPNRNLMDKEDEKTATAESEEESDEKKPKDEHPVGVEDAVFKKRYDDLKRHYDETVSKHKDEECTYEEAIKKMKELNLEIIHKSFNTVYSLPLSGGYVGINFIPQLKFLQNIILYTEEILEKLIQNSFGRRIAWRYIIVGKKLQNNKN